MSMNDGSVSLNLGLRPNGLTIRGLVALSAFLGTQTPTRPAPTRGFLSANDRTSDVQRLHTRFEFSRTGPALRNSRAIHTPHSSGTSCPTESHANKPPRTLIATRNSSCAQDEVRPLESWKFETRKTAGRRSPSGGVRNHPTPRNAWRFDGFGSSTSCRAALARRRRVFNAFSKDFWPAMTSHSHL